MSAKLDSILKRMIRSGQYATQNDLVQGLRDQGIVAKQSTVSRALSRIHAVKRMGPDGQVSYRLSPKGGGGMMGYTGLVHGVRHNGALIVVSTRPGSASHVAQYIDEQDGLDIMGTIAGDNCIFIAPFDTKTIDEMTQKLRDVFGVLAEDTAR